MQNKIIFLQWNQFFTLQQIVLITHLSAYILILLILLNQLIKLLFILLFLNTIVFLCKLASFFCTIISAILHTFHINTINTILYRSTNSILINICHQSRVLRRLGYIHSSATNRIWYFFLIFHYLGLRSFFVFKHILYFNYFNVVYA